MAEYFAGSPGIRMLLQYEFDKDMAKARHDYAESEIASQASYNEELEKLRHLNKISEMQQEHTYKTAEIGTSKDWDRTLAEEQRAWQTEENRKSREHDSTERSKDRQTDITTATISAAGRAVETVPKLLPIFGLGIGNDKNKGDKNGGKPDPNDPSTLKPGTIEYANYVFDHGPIVAPDLKSKVTGFVVNSAGEMIESKQESKGVPWYAYIAAPYLAGAIAVDQQISERNKLMNPELIQKLNNSLAVPAAGVAVTSLLKILPII